MSLSIIRKPFSSTAAALLKPLGLELRRITSWPPVAPELPERLLADCKVLPSRKHLLARLPTRGTAAEIGVAFGDFSEMILQINRPKKLFLIDPWASDRYGTGLRQVSERFADQIAAGKVQIERGLSIEVMKRLPPGSFDWLYIDTTHRYSTTKAELQLAAELVVPGGCIAGHDFSVGNPVQGSPYGVIPAVCEFCIESDFRLAYLALEAYGYFSFCLAAGKVEPEGNSNT